MRVIDIERGAGDWNQPSALALPQSAVRSVMFVHTYSAPHSAKIAAIEIEDNAPALWVGSKRYEGRPTTKELCLAFTGAMELVGLA